MEGKKLPKQEKRKQKRKLRNEGREMNHTKDTWKIGNHEFTSRFILGSGKYSLDLIKAAVEQAEAQIITLALRRVNEGGAANILDYIPQGVSLLPNTSGARDAQEAVRIARLSREVCGSDLVKIEIMRDTRYLLPDNQETIKATEILAKEGFTVMPYMYPDLDLPIIVDAGIGRPSQACEAMEMGAAAVMANTAIATAGDVPLMADAFRKAIEAGREAYLSGLGRVMEKGASPSSPLTGYLQD